MAHSAGKCPIRGCGAPMKISSADTAFAKCVKARTNWVCEKCEAQHEEGSQGLHCSHIFSRRHRTLRWCGDNAQSLCFSCHSWFGGNPADSGSWIIDLLGNGHIDLLREKRDSRMKVSKLDERDIALHYRLQLKIIDQKRLDGVTGRIEFESWQ